MTKVNANTKKGMDIIHDYEYAQRKDERSIFDAYARPSETKIETFTLIRERAWRTDGYNYDIAICGHNTSSYSTVYSYTVDGVRYIVKDTKENTFVVEVRDYE